MPLHICRNSPLHYIRNLNWATMYVGPLTHANVNAPPMPPHTCLPQMSSTHVHHIWSAHVCVHPRGNAEPAAVPCEFNMNLPRGSSETCKYRIIKTPTDHVSSYMHHISSYIHHMWTIYDHTRITVPCGRVFCDSSEQLPSAFIVEFKHKICTASAQRCMTSLPCVTYHVWTPT